MRPGITANTLSIKKPQPPIAQIRETWLRDSLYRGVLDDCQTFLQHPEPIAMKTLRLRYLPPLDWPALLDFYRFRATPGVEIVDGFAYRRSIELRGQAATIEVAPAARGPR